jgi:flagellar capping protein FliD
MTDIDEQITQMERIVFQQQEAMELKFIAMEQAQAQINQQLQYLTRSLASMPSGSK